MVNHETVQQHVLRIPCPCTGVIHLEGLQTREVLVRNGSGVNADEVVQDDVSSILQELINRASEFKQQLSREDVEENAKHNHVELLLTEPLGRFRGPL